MGYKYYRYKPYHYEYLPSEYVPPTKEYIIGETIKAAKDITWGFIGSFSRLLDIIPIPQGKIAKGAGMFLKNIGKLKTLRKFRKAKKLKRYKKLKKSKKYKTLKARRERLYRAGKKIKGRRTIDYFGRVSRAKSQFKEIFDRSELKPILKFDDIVDFVNRDEKIRDIILNNLSEAIGSNKFIFASEEELRRYVYMRDREAKICKILELEEVDIYLVEGAIFTDYWSMLSNKGAAAIMYMAFMHHYNSVITFIQTFYMVYNKLLEDAFNEIDSKLTEEKQKDINNTYCQECRCCCSCKKGSCCCSCVCNLIHYTQAWENLRTYIDEKETSLKTELYNKTVNEAMEDSLIVLYMGAWHLLQYILKTRVREKYLFIVLKKDNIVNLYLNKIDKSDKEDKIKVSRLVYEFLKEHRYKKHKYDKFIKDLQKYLKEMIGIEYTRQQIMVFINNIAKRYSIKKMTLKLNGERYLYLL